MGQGGFNPVKTDRGGVERESQGKCLHEVGHMAGREEAQGHRKRGQNQPPPPPARLNTIFRALKRTESPMDEETR